MNKKLFFLFLFFSISLLAFSQTKINKEMRDSLVTAIKNDTLPVMVTRLPQLINSEFSEYNAQLFDDSVFFFTSMRAVIQDDYDPLYSTHWYSRIYWSKLTENGFSNIEFLSKLINKSNYLHPNYTFNHDRSYIVFSRCYRNSFDELLCNLWESSIINDKWTKPKILNESINVPGFNTTQPNLIEYDDYQILYFASNRPNGMGEMDIWYSIRQKGKYDYPIHCGNVINTEYNEVTPFYDKETETLNFSSDGHVGVGGYDIFYSKGGMSVWSKPVNRGIPYNSEENDLYYSINHNGKSGFFSSNRPSLSDPDNICCNDIYSWEIRPDSLSVPHPTAIQSDSVTCFFPLSLYFDNDFPDSKSLADTTSSQVDSLLCRYVQQKDEYMNKLTDVISKDTLYKNRVEAFFMDSVARGLRILDLFAQYLCQEMKSGKNMTIEIQGFASSLHYSDYNYWLSSRRIVSFVNYLKQYDNGTLLPYINGTNVNHLNIVQLPLGNQKELSDKENKVYGLEAACQRKIVLKQIK